MTHRGNIIGVVATVALSLGALPVAAHWELYDTFNDGVIDPALWSVDDSSANITEANGVLTFHTLPGQFGISGLAILDRVERVKGVRARVWVDNDCEGDIRGFVAGYAGLNSIGNFIWVQTAVQVLNAPGEPPLHRILIAESRDTGPPNYIPRPHELWAGSPQGNGLVVTGQWVFVSVRFSDQSETVFVNEKQITRAVVKKHLPAFTPMPAGEHLVMIGTETEDYGGGSGECIVKFDWVEVYR